MSDEILFENLAYGNYIINSETGRFFTENVKYSKAGFNKLNTQKVRLPDGKGNIIYLLTDSFNRTLQMVNNNNFIVPPSYHRMFYPWVSFGRFLGRRYSMNIKKDLTNRNKELASKTNLRPYNVRSIPKTIENIFFCTSDLFTAVKPIMEKSTIKRNYTEFFPTFVDMINEFTPPKNDKLKGSDNNNRIIIIDCDSFNFKPDGSLNDNKTNPLFLLYLAYLRTRDLSKMNVDIDMMICSKNMFMKFNPKQLIGTSTWSTFRLGLFRIMNMNLDDYTSRLSEKDQKEISTTASDTIVSTVVNNVIDPYTKMVSPATKAVVANAVENNLKQKVKDIRDIDKEIKDTQAEVNSSISSKPLDLFKQSIKEPDSLIHVNPVKDPLIDKQVKLFNTVVKDYAPLQTASNLIIDDDLPPTDEEDEDILTDEEMNDYKDTITDDATEVLTADEEVADEVLTEIQDKTVPLNNPKTAPINSARDKKLREEQKKIVVKESTIEEILERDTTNVPIEVDDKSAVMHTSNKNMQTIKFANFEKTYLDKLYVPQLLACFDMLKDKGYPFYITNIDIKDTSDILNLKETWTVSLTDETKKRYTIKVDIPKFLNNRFMLLGGTKYIILKQNFYNPLVKDTPDSVIVTTNYNKITINRKATKSLSTVERIFSLIKNTGDTDIFTTGDSTRGNMKYISCLEYDELARRLFKFKSGKCEIYFSRDYINENLSDKIPDNIKGNEFYIGHEGSNPILINEDTGMDRSGKTISDIIEANLPENYQSIYSSIRAPKQSMFVEAKLAGKDTPIISTLLVWVGLTKTLEKMKIRWNFIPNAKRVPAPNTSTKYIRFADGLLEYEAKTFAELILNGLAKLHPEKKTFKDFDTEAGYDDFVYAIWGSYKGINELKNFYEFLIDPITKKVCKDSMLPTEPDELLIYAVKLLSDNAYVSKASDKSYRIRSIEMIPSILYSCIAKQYKNHINSGRRIPMTLNQNCVISALLAEKTVEAYSTLNPVIEVSKANTISTKGYKGSNSEHSYDEEKRSYDPTSVGKLAISTSADANVGINKNLVVEPTITNAMGYRDQVEDPDTLKDVNIFSPAEMLTPGTARNDDPIRTAIATKQSQHTVPVEDASPALISNGYDEAVQFHLSDDFVINAEEDGKVVDVNEELGFIVVKYNSGKTKAIYTKPEIVKNSGGGFYMSNQLTPVYTKVGEKFKKDMVLAYHPKYFKYSKMNGLRYAIGPIVKMAFMSSYNTYEDAGICTETLGERMATSIVYEEVGRFKRNNNIIEMVKVGDHVNIGDSLIKFDASIEDDALSDYLVHLNEDNAELLKEETRNDVKASHAGVIIDIKVYTLLDPSNLTPTLGKVVQDYFDQGINKKKYLEQFDGSDGIIKAGYMLTDATEPIKSRYNSIKGNKGIDVLIEFHIEHKDVAGVGDKIALYGPNKQIISEVIPKGWEPYSEFRPDEEISVLTSPGTIARRMTSSVIAISAAMKCMVELKRKVKEEIKYK